MVRAVLFDLDGTLVDALDDIHLALQRALEEFGLACADRATVRTWIGGGARNLVQQALARHRASSPPPGSDDAVFARFRAHYAAAPVVHTRLYAGIPAALDALAARGLPLAVLSNKPHDLTVTICERLLAPWSFAHISGARDGVPLKPDPSAALAIADELGVAAAACAYVGDSAIDVAMAHAAGMRAVAVSWGFRPRAELVAAGPAVVVDDPAALADAV